MGYVDLRRRREERRPGSLGYYAGSNPYPLLAAGFLLGRLSSSNIYYHDPFTALLLVIAAITLPGYVSWLLLGRDQINLRQKIGGAKHLLMAILDAGGSFGRAPNLAHGGRGDPHPASPTAAISWSRAATAPS